MTPPAVRLAIFALAITIAIGTAVGPAQAALSGTAERGDNCTPFNTYRIGYSTATGTIIDQSVVLAHGWNLIGWIIQDRSGARFFVPYVPYYENGSGRDVSGAVPSLFAVRKGLSGLADAYERYLQRRSQDDLGSDAPMKLPQPSLVAPCFARALSVR